MPDVLEPAVIHRSLDIEIECPSSRRNGVWRSRGVANVTWPNQRRTKGFFTEGRFVPIADLKYASMFCMV
jgi:hypothetical protein